MLNHETEIKWLIENYKGRDDLTILRANLHNNGYLSSTELSTIKDLIEKLPPLSESQK